MTTITENTTTQATEHDPRVLGPVLIAAAMLLAVLLGVALVAGQLVDVLRWALTLY